MKGYLVIFGSLLVAACAQPVTKVPVATGGSKADGTITMAYDYSFGEQVTANWLEAKHEAEQRCAAWGYRRAEEFAGVRNMCSQFGTGMFASTCMRGIVAKNYQCLD